ncbi:MAG: hypothetical protein B7X58_01270 [Marinobacter sp. 34-60-7]|nr:MAG: hypothetical protein B7X58_01270 [Marinobacter sp. 34-60-7]
MSPAELLLAFGVCNMRPPIPHAITSFVAATLLSVSVPVSAAENTRFERGSEVYNQQCAACHQAQGQGIPGSFPPQKNHTAQMYNATDGIGGRRYLGHVLQYGLTGPIKVDGTSYNGNMPAWGGALTSQQMADVLNYVLTAFGNEKRIAGEFQPYTPEDIEAIAGKDELSLEKSIRDPLYVAVQNSGIVKVLPSKQAWPGVAGAHYDALSPDGSRLMVSGFKTGNVYVLNTASGEVMASVPIGEVAQGVKISPDGRYGLAVAPTQGDVAVIDMNTLELVRKIPVGKVPHNLVYSADGTLAYVTLQGEGALAVVDMRALEKQRQIPTPGLKTPHNIDISANGQRLWLRDFTGNVGVLDLASETMLKTFKVGSGHGGIDVVPGEQYVATGAISASVVTIIDSESLKIVKNVDVGVGPHGVRASRDGQFIYASVTADNHIAVIDTQSLEVVRREPVGGQFPFWLAVPGNP